MKTGLFCSSLAWGGLEINTLKLCIRLKERGQNIILICLKDTPLYEEAAKNKIETIHFKYRNKHFVFGSASRLAQLLYQHQIATLIIGHYSHHYVSVWAKVFSKQTLHLVYWQQMQLLHNRKDFYHAFFFRQIDYWITPLQYLKNQLLSNTVLSEAKIKVIPLGVDFTLFTESQTKKEVYRKLLTLPATDFIIGNVGRIDAQKGQEYIVHAIKKLKERNLPIKAVLIGSETVGEEGYLQTLQNLVKKVGLEEEVLFRPFIKESHIAFASLDVFVMSSLSEPIGMVTIEAMATNVPVIGTNKGGTPELLAYGKAGMLYEPTDSNQLADLIQNLYEDEGKRIALCKEAQLQIKKYSHELQCSQFIELLHTIKE